MSATTSTPWIPPRPTPEILRVDTALVPEYMTWFVNRRAYTRQRGVALSQECQDGL